MLRIYASRYEVITRLIAGKRVHVTCLEYASHRVAPTRAAARLQQGVTIILLGGNRLSERYTP